MSTIAIIHATSQWHVNGVFGVLHTGGKTLIKQEKKGRPPSKSPMVHTAVVLPRELIERLKRDAETSNRGLSAEIRQRLQTSYDMEGLPADPRTRDLIECIKDLADQVERDLGVQWYKHKFALEAFEAGVALLVRHNYAKDDGPASPDPQFVGYPDDAPPEVVGTTHARRILRDRLGDKSE
jgi:hypothetical protein